MKPYRQRDCDSNEYHRSCKQSPNHFMSPGLFNEGGQLYGFPRPSLGESLISSYVYPLCGRLVGNHRIRTRHTVLVRRRGFRSLEHEMPSIELHFGRC